MPCAEESKQQFEKWREAKECAVRAFQKQNILVWRAAIIIVWGARCLKMKMTLLGGKRENLWHIVRRASMKRWKCTSRADRWLHHQPTSSGVTKHTLNETKRVFFTRHQTCFCLPFWSPSGDWEYWRRTELKAHLQPTGFSIACFVMEIRITYHSDLIG